MTNQVRRPTENALLDAIFGDSAIRFFPYSGEELREFGITELPALEDSTTIITADTVQTLGTLGLVGMRIIDNALGLGEDGLAALYETSTDDHVRSLLRQKQIIGQRSHTLGLEFARSKFRRGTLFPMRGDQLYRLGIVSLILRGGRRMSLQRNTPSIKLEDLSHESVLDIHRTLGIDLCSKWCIAFETEQAENELCLPIPRALVDEIQQMKIIGERPK